MHNQHQRINPLPSIDWLRENIRYVPETGEVWWIKPGRRRILGKPAGSVAKGRYYIKVGVSGRYFQVKRSRLVFALTVGRWPDCMDHINGNTSDDRWENLREVTNAENLRNKKQPKTNKSGVTGVCWYKKTNKWQAYINHIKKEHLGFYATIEEAIAVRKAAEKRYGYHPNHGRVLKNGVA